MDESELNLPDRRIVAIIYDADADDFDVDDGDMPWHEVLGLLVAALDYWRNLDFEQDFLDE